MTSLFARIRWRLVAWNMLVLTLVLAAMAIAVYAALSASLTDRVDRTLVAEAATFTGDVHEIDEALQRAPKGYRGGFFYLLFDARGTVLADPQSLELEHFPLPATIPAFVDAEVGDEPARVYYSPLTLTDGSRLTLAVGQPLAEERDTVARLVLVLLLAMGGAALLALAGAWFLAGRALVPIERAFERQREFVADASHELRTPLAVLRSATDLLARHRDEPLARNAELLDDTRAEIARMERLVADLLTLARSDSHELPLALGELDLGALASGVVRKARALALEASVHVGVEPAPGVLVEADPDRLEQVLLILVDNAVRHTPAGGSVTVAVTRSGAEGVAEVSDTGEGIASADLARVFDRFYRADAARAGGARVGLGLAIARSLVEAHGGSIGITSAVGTGTTVTVRLPLARMVPAAPL